MIIDLFAKKVHARQNNVGAAKPHLIISAMIVKSTRNSRRRNIADIAILKSTMLILKSRSHCKTSAKKKSVLLRHSSHAIEYLNATILVKASRERSIVLHVCMKNVLIRIIMISLERIFATFVLSSLYQVLQP